MYTWLALGNSTSTILIQLSLHDICSYLFQDNTSIRMRLAADMEMPCLIHMCAMTYSHVCHDSWICLPSLIHMCDMTQSYVCHDSFMRLP